MNGLQGLNRPGSSRAQLWRHRKDFDGGDRGNNQMAQSMSAKGSLASISACPQHVRLGGNLGNAGCPVLSVGGIGCHPKQAAWRSSCRRPARLEQHLLGSCAQVLPGATCLSVGGTPAHRTTGRRSRRGGADDRYLRRAGVPARNLHRGQQSPRYRSLARGPIKQDSRGGGCRWPAGPSRPHAR